MTAAETVWINIISSPAGLEVQPLVCFNEPISPRSADKFSSKVHSDDKYPKRPLHHLAQRRLTFTAEAQMSLCTLPCPAEHTHTPPRFLEGRWIPASAQNNARRRLQPCASPRPGGHLMTRSCASPRALSWLDAQSWVCQTHVRLRLPLT